MSSAAAASPTGRAGPSAHGEHSEMARAGAWSNNAGNYSRVADFNLQYGAKALDIVGLQPGEKVLEVACGTGRLALHAARSKLADVHAIDFAPALIHGLQAEIEAHPADVTARVMDGAALEYPNATFDVACSAFGVLLFPDWVKGLAEMARVTRPGGRVAVVTWAEPRRGPVSPWVRLLGRDFPEALPLPFTPGAAALDTKDGVTAALGAAGWDAPHAEEVTFWRDYPDVQEAVQVPLIRLRVNAAAATRARALARERAARP
jgi:ubiquinone/menaquinone biosynthesis C-methylase UbiE